jgi:hypothetical protein
LIIEMKTLLTFLSFLIYLFQSLLLFIYSFLVSELSSIRDILSIGFVALEQRGKAFVRPLCNLMEVIGLPYVRTKSHEEYSSNAVAALSDILRVLVAVLMWNEPEIQLAAAKSLLSFVTAMGFDAVSESVATPNTNAAGIIEGMTGQTTWSFHQDLLRESDVLPDLVRALRHQVTQYLSEAAIFKAQTARLLQEAVQSQGTNVETSQTNNFSNHNQDNDSDDLASLDQAHDDRYDNVASNDSQLVDADATIQRLATTHAVKSAAVTQMPELLTLIARIMRECTEHDENSIILTRNELPRLCVDILSRVTSVRDDLVHLSIEMLWNLLELSHERVTAAANGSYGEASLTLDGLLHKHRYGNALRMLGTEFDVRVLGNLLESCLVLRGCTQADREFRNDVVVVASLIATRPENKPFFASTGFLAVLLHIATAAEAASSSGGGVGAGGGAHARRLRATISQSNGNQSSSDVVSSSADNFSAVTPIDLEFKQLSWSLIGSLCSGPFADREVILGDQQEEASADAAISAAQAAAQGGDNHSPTCLSLVRSSSFISTLLKYVDPSAPLTNAYLAAWSPPSKRKLEIQALHLLATIGTSFPSEIVNQGGLEILCKFLSYHSAAVMDARDARAAGSGNSNGPVNNDEDEYMSQKASIKGSRSFVEDEGDDGFVSSSTKAAANPPRPPIQTVTKMAGSNIHIAGGKPPRSNANAAASAASSSLPFTPYPRGEDDIGRKVWCLRVLHALCDIETRSDPESHLSSFLTAGVPTTVAKKKFDNILNGNLARPPSAGSLWTAASAASASPLDGPRTGAIGNEIAAKLGELGLLSDLVFILKRREVERQVEAKNAESAEGAAKVKAAATAAIISRLSAAGSSGGSGRGQGVTEVTPASQIEEGRKAVEPELLTEEALSCVAVLMKGSADAKVALESQNIHSISGLADDVARITEGAGDHLNGVDSPGKISPPDILPQFETEGQVKLQRGRIVNVASNNNQVVNRFPSLREDTLGEDTVDEIEDSTQFERDDYDLQKQDGNVIRNRGNHPPTHVTSTASTASVHVSLISRIKENQDRFRKAGGVSMLIRYLKACVVDSTGRAGGEFSTTGTRPRVAIAAAFAIHAACVGNVRSEARLLADGGIDALLDLVEAAPSTLRPLALTSLADLSRNPISHVCVRCWRSERTGYSAGRMLLTLWQEEETRLGVIHDEQTGAINNFSRPLDGGNAKKRQQAVFAITHTPTAAAVKDIVPGGRIAIQAANLEAGFKGGSNGTGVLDSSTHGKGRRSSVQGETYTFRGLRRALRAARLWQHVESATPGGPLATPVLQTDLRHKIFSCLMAIGFNEVEVEIKTDEDNERKEGKDDTVESRSSTVAFTEAFNDLNYSTRMSLELCKASPELIVGSAWDDVQTRMAEMGVACVNSDRIALETQLDASANVASRVRKLQLIQSNAKTRAMIEGEHLLFSRVLDRREQEEAALRFAEKNKRRPWASAGKTYTGRTMEEKKAGQVARAEMLTRSLLGYVTKDGAFEGTNTK